MSIEQNSIDSSVGGTELRDVVRQAIEEFVRTEQRQAEPVYKVELQEERKRRETLEARVNQLIEENKRARAAADEVERHAQIRTELQRAGISKIDLAFRAIKDEIVRADNGRLQAKGPDSKSLQEYISSFVQENPELLPARISGGSGAQSPARQGSAPDTSGISLESIRPGMSKEELERVRDHISKLATQALRGR